MPGNYWNYLQIQCQVMYGKGQNSGEKIVSFKDQSDDMGIIHRLLYETMQNLEEHKIMAEFI